MVPSKERIRKAKSLLLLLLECALAKERNDLQDSGQWTSDDPLTTVSILT